MTSKPYIDHRELSNWIEQTKRVFPMQIDTDMLELSVAKVDQDSPADAKGHMMTPDGRLAIRVILDSEAQSKFGAGGLSIREAITLMHRIASMGEIERVALDMQRDMVLMRRAMVPIYDAVSRGVLPDSKAIVAASRALRETET